MNGKENNLLSTLSEEVTSLQKQLKMMKQNMANIEELVRLVYANRLIDNTENQMNISKNNLSINELSCEVKSIKQELASIKEQVNISRENTLRTNKLVDNITNQIERQKANSTSPISNIIRQQERPKINVPPIEVKRKKPTFHVETYWHGNPNYPKVYNKDYRDYFLDKTSININLIRNDEWTITFYLIIANLYGAQKDYWRKRIGIKSNNGDYQILCDGWIIDKNSVFYAEEYNAGLYILANFDLE